MNYSSIWNNFVVLALFLNNNKRNCQLKIRPIAEITCEAVSSRGFKGESQNWEYEIDLKKRSGVQRKQNNNADLAW